MPRTRSRSSASAWRACPLASTHERLRGGGVVVDPLGSQTELHGQHDQALLGAVVKVALDAPELGRLDVEDGPSADLERLDALLERASLRDAQEPDDHGAMQGHESARHLSPRPRQDQADEAAEDGDSVEVETAATVEVERRKAPSANQIGIESSPIEVAHSAGDDRRTRGWRAGRR